MASSASSASSTASDCSTAAPAAPAATPDVAALAAAAPTEGGGDPAAASVADALSASTPPAPAAAGTPPPAAAAPPPATVPADTEVLEQRRRGGQSCRGIGQPDLSPLGGDPHALRVFRELLGRERALAGAWAAFYHSYNSPALVYEVQATVAKVLFRFSAQHGSLPRLLKKPFDKLQDAAAVLKAFPTWPDQDHNSAFKAVGICCSTSLVSTDPEATPTQVFLQGYAASTVSIAVLEKLLRDCGAGLNRCNVKTLAQEVMALAQKHGLPQATGAGNQGHLLQIFIRRSCVDKWAYASLPMGVPDSTRQPFSKHLASKGPITGQARVIVNPSAFMRASSVRLHAVSADEAFHKKRPTFQEELSKLLSPVLGNPKVRERAAAGIYGGKLPSWWKDLCSEEQEEDTTGTTSSGAQS